MLPLVKVQEQGRRKDRIERATNRAGYANEKTEACKNHHKGKKRASGKARLDRPDT